MSDLFTWWSRDFTLFVFSCLIVIIFLLIIVVMVITATLLAVFLSPRNVTFTCNNVLITNWTNISRPGNEEPAAHMTLQVMLIVYNLMQFSKY